MACPTAYTALVAGATGAVGREVVAQLVSSSHCAKVIALTRREVPQNQWPTAFPSLDAEAATGKLEVRKVDYDTLGESNINAEDKIDAVFSCLGTTRKDAGSAEAFRKVDLEYVSRMGQLTKASNATYFGLLTSMGANKNSWFLYPQTKGESEEQIKALDFARTSIFRPGLLLRGDLARGVEKIGAYLSPSIQVSAVAKAMVNDFETGSAKVREWSHREMKAFDK